VGRSTARLLLLREMMSHDRPGNPSQLMHRRKGTSLLDRERVGCRAPIDAQRRCIAVVHVGSCCDSRAGRPPPVPMSRDTGRVVTIRVVPNMAALKLYER